MLNIAERFFSVQGEGITTGIPSIFIRLQGCNLMCGGPGGQLVKLGQATWWCDSETIWRQGTKVSNKELLQFFKDENQLDNVNKGITHLIWTGGEPTMPKHQESIIEFMDFMDCKYFTHSIYNEIETNGTIKFEDIFYTYISQINCSPKLANSGMSRGMRIKKDVIEQINDHHNSWFKFVVSIEDDIKEIENEWIKDLNIDPRKIILMPGVDNRDDLSERTRFVFDMTKKYGYRSCTRAHILAWDAVTGV